MFKNYFLSALRTLRKNRSVNWINITGLAAGMTSAVLVFLWVQNELTFDNYHPQADRIYRTTAHLKKAHWVWSTSPFPLAAAIKESLPEVEQSARVSNAGGINFHIGEEYFAEKQAAYVDKNWFGLFHYDFVSGSPASFLQQPYSLILSETKAKKYFGKKDPIGQTIRIDTVDYRVQAVIKDNPANSSFQWDVLLPMEPMLTHPDQRDNATKFNNFNCLTFMKVRAGVDPKKLGAKITSVVTSHKKDSDIDMDVIPLKEMHFETGLTSSGSVEHADKKTVYIFSILGIFLLIIACINYVNLTTARASLRAKEVSVRKIVGAGKKSLFAQFIIESLLISTVSVLITLLLVRLSLPWYRDLTGKNFADPLLSAGMWKIIGVTLLSATILNGIYPAMLLSSFQPLNVFKGVSILKVKDAWFRKSLVVLQFTFSVILIISTILIHQQLHFIQDTNPGYDRSQLLSFTIPWQTFHGQSEDQEAGVMNTIKQELSSQTSIAGVSITTGSTVKVSSSNSGSADWDGHDTTYTPTVYQLGVDEDYQQLLHIEMAQGRWFRPHDLIDRHNFILNETAIHEFNIRKPVIGQRFSFQGDTGKIIGVVKDFHFASMHDKIAPLCLMNRPYWSTNIYVKTAPGKTSQALAASKALWQRYVFGKPFEYTFFDDEFDKMYRADAKLSTLILIFSVIAIVISCLGLFGLATFTAEQRTKEIGIRKVLGATVGSLVTLLSKDFARLVAISILIASPIAWWALHKWLQDFAYHVPIRISIFVLSGALAILIALVTISSQAIKAALSNPVLALRTE